MPRRPLLLLCLAGALAAPGAAADKLHGVRATVALWRFEVVGVRDVDQELEAEVRGALKERLELVPAQRVDALGRENPSLRRCGTEECARKVAAALSARWLAHGRVEQDGDSSYGIELELVDGQTGRTVPARPERCDPCGWTELRSKVAELTRLLATRCEALGVEAPPAKEGEAVGGATVVPRPRLEPPPRRPVDALVVGKWAAVGAAAVLVATGAVLLADDGHPSCDPPPGLRCPHYYDTRLEGGLVLGFGVASAVAAALLFGFDWYRYRGVAPSVAVDLHGASLGLAGRF